MEIVIGYVFIVAAFVLGFILGADRTDKNSDVYFVLLVSVLALLAIVFDPILGFMDWQLFTAIEILSLCVGYAVGIIIGS